MLTRTLKTGLEQKPLSKNTRRRRIFERFLPVLSASDDVGHSFTVSTKRNATQTAVIVMHDRNRCVAMKMGRPRFGCTTHNLPSCLDRADHDTGSRSGQSQCCNLASLSTDWGAAVGETFCSAHTARLSGLAGLPQHLPQTIARRRILQLLTGRGNAQAM